MSDASSAALAHTEHTDHPVEEARGDPAAKVLSGLRQLILDAHPSAHGIALDGLVRSAGGLSRENWSFDATWTDAQGAHHHRLMLMRDAAGTLLHTDRARECAVLKALEHTAIPAPHIFWMDEQGQRLGAPSVVMERMPGVCDYMALNGPGPLDARLSLAQDFLALMATIHAVDWRALGLGERLGVPEGAPSLRDLAHWEGEYRRAQLEPHPELDYVLSWLRRRAPQAEALVLVHGDFKPGNALVEEVGVWNAGIHGFIVSGGAPVIARSVSYEASNYGFAIKSASSALSAGVRPIALATIRRISERRSGMDVIWVLRGGKGEWVAVPSR
jgi:hypothetical protein